MLNEFEFAVDCSIYKKDKGGILVLKGFQRRSHAILGGKIAPPLEPFQNKDSSLVLLIYGTVNGELKFIQHRSKNRF